MYEIFNIAISDKYCGCKVGQSLPVNFLRVVFNGMIGAYLWSWCRTNPDGGKERPMVGRLWSLADVFGHLVMLWGYVWSLGQLWWGRLMTERVSQSLVG